MVRALATIWFRVLALYSVFVLCAVFLVFPDEKPWHRHGREILDEKPVFCDEVEPAAAAGRVEQDKRRLAELGGGESEPALSQEFLSGLMGLTERTPAALKERLALPGCIEYRERLADWYATAERNWRSAEYWASPTRRAAIFVIPAWLIWAAVYWAIFAPLLRREDSGEG